MSTILIVEDEQILREAYVNILTQEGFTVLTAPDGEAALTQLNMAKPDLRLLDLLMPKMDGFAFLQAADLQHRRPEIKVLAFSNLSEHQRLQEMVKAGTLRHVLKSSLSPKELAATVREMLDSSRYEG
jgi:CheY-like chemotaxis protein